MFIDALEEFNQHKGTQSESQNVDLLVGYCERF